MSRTLKNNEKESWWLPAIKMFGVLSGWVAIPVLLGTFIGKKIDAKLNTEPWYMLITVGVAFVISIIAIIVKTNKEFKNISDETKKSNK